MKLTDIKGINKKKAEKLKAHDLYTVADLALAKRGGFIKGQWIDDALQLTIAEYTANGGEILDSLLKVHAQAIEGKAEELLTDDDNEPMPILPPLPPRRGAIRQAALMAQRRRCGPGGCKT